MNLIHLAGATVALAVLGPVAYRWGYEKLPADAAALTVGRVESDADRNGRPTEGAYLGREHAIRGAYGGVDLVGAVTVPFQLSLRDMIAEAKPYDPWKQTPAAAVAHGMDFRRLVSVVGIYDGADPESTFPPPNRSYRRGLQPGMYFYTGKPHFRLAGPSNGIFQAPVGVYLLHLQLTYPSAYSGLPASALEYSGLKKGDLVRIIGFFEPSTVPLGIGGPGALIGAVIDTSYVPVISSGGYKIDDIVAPIERAEPKKVSLKEKKENGDTLLQAAISGDWETVQQAAEEGGLINTRVEHDHSTALSYALTDRRLAPENRRKVVKMLLSYGAQPVETLTRNSLVEAVHTGDPELVVLLLRAGADPQAKVLNGTPLTEAMAAKNEAILGVFGLLRRYGDGPLTPAAAEAMRAKLKNAPAAAERATPTAAGGAPADGVAPASAGAAAVMNAAQVTPPSEAPASVIAALVGRSVAHGMNGPNADDRFQIRNAHVENGVMTAEYWEPEDKLGYEVAGPVTDLTWKFKGVRWLKNAAGAVGSPSAYSADMRYEKGVLTGTFRFGGLAGLLLGEKAKGKIVVDCLGNPPAY